MNSRDLMVAVAVAATEDKELAEELAYHLDVQEQPDYYTALSDIEDRAQYNRDRRLLKYARRALITLGVYRAVTDEELSRTQTMGGRKFDFTLDGLKYVFDKHP